LIVPGDLSRTRYRFNGFRRLLWIRHSLFPRGNFLSFPLLGSFKLAFALEWTLGAGAFLFELN